ncbi:MAG: hypothetical protein LN567_04555 [Rickettsia endosymbiont of Graphium doson]|nr:hypothetical protein [Rickettsia endosymbiont of Graphium doson]
MTQKEHPQTTELNQIKNAKILHFKDEHGKAVDGHLIVGEVEHKEKINLERKREIEVKRDLGKFKKILAFLGIIKRTEKITVNEIFPVESVRKEEQIIGAFTKDKKSIENFLDDLDFHETKLYAYDLNGKKVGEVGDFAKIILDEGVKFDETILEKNGKVFAIKKNNEFLKSFSASAEKDNQFLDLKGKPIPNQNQFKQESNKIYYLGSIGNERQATKNTLKSDKRTVKISEKAATKTFHKNEKVDTSKGKKSLDKKPARSALKGSREVAKKIGEELRKEQEKNFAGINKKPKAAALKKVETPKVPTR